MNTQDRIFHRHTISLAKQARQAGELPFGAELVINGNLVAEAQYQCYV